MAHNPVYAGSTPAPAISELIDDEGSMVANHEQHGTERERRDEVARFLSLAEVAAIAGVKTAAGVRRWIREGVVGVAGPVAGGRLKHPVKLKATHFPGGAKVRLSDLEDFLAVISGTGGARVWIGRAAAPVGGRARVELVRNSHAVHGRTGSPPALGSGRAAGRETVVAANGKRYEA